MIHFMIHCIFMPFKKYKGQSLEVTEEKKSNEHDPRLGHPAQASVQEICDK